MIVNLIAFASSFSKTTSEYASGRDVAGTFGLQSDQDYPLVVGSRFGGSSVEATASAGVFSARAYVSSQPASAISIGFTYQNKSYILEVPVSKVTFIQSTYAKPTVRMHLDSTAFLGAQYLYKYSGHHCGVRNLWVVCLPKRVGAPLKVGPESQRRGLAPIVSDYLDSATITLTPAMYKEILGTP